MFKCTAIEGYEYYYKLMIILVEVQMSKMRSLFVIVISVLANFVACQGMVILIFLVKGRVHVQLVLLMHMFT